MIAACIWRGGQEGGVYDCGVCVEGWSSRGCLWLRRVCGGVVRQGVFIIAACMWRGGQEGGVYDCGVCVEGWSSRKCL